MPAWLTLSALRSLPWKWIGRALAVAGLVFAIHHHGYTKGRHSRDAEVSALSGTITNLKAASAKAKADNETFVARVNALQDQVTKERNDEAPKQLADARAALAAYVRMHPATAQGHTGRDIAPGIPNAPSQPDAASSEAIVLVADLDACAQAYVVATGLQDWIKAEAAINRGITK